METHFSLLMVMNCSGFWLAIVLSMVWRRDICSAALSRAWRADYKVNRLIANIGIPL